MRTVLALDTATEACSAALLRGDELIGRFSEGGLSHARRILGMVDAVLEEAGMTLSMLDGIAASIGPGAFTGVRISVAVAQGLAFGADLPVVAVTTLEALASRILSRGAAGALACLDARMGEVYWGCFAPDAERGLAAVGAARVGPPGSVALPAGGCRRPERRCRRAGCSVRMTRPRRAVSIAGSAAALPPIRRLPRCLGCRLIHRTAGHCRMPASSRASAPCAWDWERGSIPPTLCPCICAIKSH